MKVSYNWLQTFFDAPLPSPRELETLLTFHSCEIEEVVPVGDDTILDVKVLPDKSSWLFSHRGIAKELSVIASLPMKRDPFTEVIALEPVAANLSITRRTDTCDYYSAAVMTGVKVGPSPAWLQARLLAIGQRSINNVVDATNYVMFELGQPLHAFDAGKLSHVGGKYQVGVRAAQPAETIVTLTGDSHTLTDADAIIIDVGTDTPIGIAGIKGGLVALVDAGTTTLIIESAHFERGAIRQTSKRLRLATDASKRYENGISKAVAPIALEAVVQLITECAGGALVGYQAVGDAAVNRAAVTCSLTQLRSVLGIDLSVPEVTSILTRFGYEYTITETEVTVIPPFERDDLVIAEDLIEEIGRMYGLGAITSIPPVVEPVAAYNARHFYAEIVRTTLIGLGFSEIYTSSFRDTDIVHIKNALASDKSYLRSRFHENLKEAVQKNIPHRDLLGLSAIKVFEIGTVFAAEGESVMVGLGVQTGTTYKAKIDDAVLGEAQSALAEGLATPLTWIGTNEGVSEFSLDEVVLVLPKPTQYPTAVQTLDIVYTPFSIYPSVSRDIALWVPLETTTELVETVLRAAASDLCVRLTLFDTFIKDERTSLAFRLVFQSKQKTLAASDVDAVMTAVYAATSKAGWEAR